MDWGGGEAGKSHFNYKSLPALGFNQRFRFFRFSSYSKAGVGGT
jgi:hypothetical protein